MCDHKDYAKSFVTLLDQALMEDGLVVDKYFNITPDLFKNRWERFAVCEGKRLVFFEEPPLLEESTSLRNQVDQTDRKKKEEDFLAKWAPSLSVLEKNPNFIPVMILDRNMINSTCMNIKFFS